MRACLPACVHTFHYVFDNRLAFFVVVGIIMSLIFLSLCCFFFFFSCVPHFSVIAKRFQLPKALYKFPLSRTLRIQTKVYRNEGPVPDILSATALFVTRQASLIRSPTAECSRPNESLLFTVMFDSMYGCREMAAHASFLSTLVYFRVFAELRGRLTNYTNESSPTSASSRVKLVSIFSSSTFAQVTEE